MSDVIEVHQLSKTYSPRPGRSSHAEPTVAVADVSFHVTRGEVVCLLGPNGAGKTTTTEILEGYQHRSGGDVAVLGVDPSTGGRALRERIGVVPQEGGLLDDLTVAEALDMYGAYYPRRMSTREAIALVELDGKAGERIGRLSGGQRRRVEVALALVGRPDLVFLDEPTTGFDPVARRATWATLRRLSQVGTTVLLTTHFMDEAEALADRIVVIDQGRVVAEGSPTTLGGRDARATRIAATVAGMQQRELPDLRGVDVEVAGDRLQVRTHDPATTTHLLTDWALDLGLRVEDLSVTRPSLEDIYLDLIHPTASEVSPSSEKERIS